MSFYAVSANRRIVYCIAGHMNFSRARMQEIRSHTSMRGLAALAVVLFHYRIELPYNLNPDRYTDLLLSANYFVDFFFMLSGFIISFVYNDKFRDGVGAFGRYFRSRVARIYPLHALTLIWMVLLALYSSRRPYPEFLTEIATNTFAIHAWGFHSAYALNFPSWSISGEFAAYLAFPLLLSVFIFRGRVAALGVIGLGLIGLHEYLIGGLGQNWERLALLRAIPGFMLGMGLYAVRGGTADLGECALSALQIAALSTLAVMMHFGAGLFWLTPVFASLIILTWEDRGLAPRLLDNTMTRRLGLLSYTIYMLHVPVRATGYLLWPWIPVDMQKNNSQLLFVASCLVVTLILSEIVHRRFEIPMRNRIRSMRFF